MFHAIVQRAFPGLALICASTLLLGCIDPERRLYDKTNQTRASECDNGGSKACYFRNSPVKTLPQAVRIPGRSALFYPIAQPLEFVDRGNYRWKAPKYTLTDGASIPVLFVPFVGAPQTPSFRNAAALHDAYCGVGNELLPEYHSDSWQNVHQMFYDTLVVGGTPKLKAKVMFAAVWLGGPRWYRNKTPDNRLANAPDELKIEAFLDTVRYINTTNPDIPHLIDYMKWREIWIYAQANERGRGRSADSGSVVTPQPPKPAKPTPVVAKPVTTPKPVVPTPVVPKPVGGGKGTSGAVQPGTGGSTAPVAPPVSPVSPGTGGTGATGGTGGKGGTGGISGGGGASCATITDPACAGLGP